jgi:hypothetical protein
VHELLVRKRKVLRADVAREAASGLVEKRAVPRVAPPAEQVAEVPYEPPPLAHDRRGIGAVVAKPLERVRAIITRVPVAALRKSRPPALAGIRRQLVKVPELFDGGQIEIGVRLEVGVEPGRAGLLGPDTDERGNRRCGTWMHSTLRPRHVRRGRFGPALIRLATNTSIEDRVDRVQRRSRVVGGSSAGTAVVMPVG